MEFSGNYRDTGASVEFILFFTCLMTTSLKNICIIVHREKLARNIDAAISDWFLAKNDEKTYKIMKRYAFTSRLSTLFIVYSTYICTAIYISIVLLINVKQIFIQGVKSSNGNVFVKFLIR